jgi:Protein of unknown function (DUF4229)
VRAFAVYTVGRLLVFVGAAALLYVVGLRGFVLVLVALLLSLPLSYLLLARARAAFVAEVERRVSDRRARREDLRARLRGDDETTG